MQNDHPKPHLHPRRDRKTAGYHARACPTDRKAGAAKVALSEDQQKALQLSERVAMNLTQEIKKRLQTVHHKALVRKLGYRNTDAGLRTVEAFMKSENIYTWLKNGHFDLYYDAAGFLVALCEQLKLPQHLCKEEITAANRRIETFSRMKTPYITVRTNFKRTGESITTLVAMGSRLRISLKKEDFVEKNREDAISFVSDIVKKHYREHSGKLPLWGKITGYDFHYIDGTVIPCF